MPYMGDGFNIDDFLKTFTTHEEMLEELARQRKAANAAIQPWQEVIKPGDFFLSAWFDVLIYNQVVEDEPGPGEVPLPPQERLVRAYSVLAPDGELGYAHISSAVRPLSQAQFELARERGWPSSERELVSILMTVQ